MGFFPQIGMRLQAFGFRVENSIIGLSQVMGYHRFDCTSLTGLKRQTLTLR